jgi:hypothetical protein
MKSDTVQDLAGAPRSSTAPIRLTARYGEQYTEGGGWLTYRY